MTKSRRIRRLFQIRIRTLLILIALIAILCHWTISQTRRVRVQEDLAALEANFAIEITYDWQEISGLAKPLNGPRGPKWIRDLTGHQFFQRVVAVDASASPQCIICIPVVGSDTTDTPSVPPSDNVMVDPEDYWTSSDYAREEYLLTRVGQLKTIRRLDLSGCIFDEEILGHLEGLSRLEELNLGETAITGEGLRFLSRMNRLRSLDIGNSLVSDAALHHLRCLTALEELDLSNTQITWRRLDYLSKLQSLIRLDLSGTPLGKPHSWDANLDSLANLTSLIELDLGETHLADWDGGELQFLASLTELQRLDLSENKNVSGGCLEYIAKLVSLIWLNLRKTSIGDDNVAQLRTLKHINYLDLHYTNVTENGMNALRKAMPHVDFAGFSGRPNFEEIPIGGDGKSNDDNEENPFG